MLTGSTLQQEDLRTGGYVDLLDADEYYTVSAARPVRRQRINDNLLGDARFCPTIRRTDVLRAFEEADLPARCQKIVADCPPQVLKRAMSCLYTKETKSSFEVERKKYGIRLRASAIAEDDLRRRNVGSGFAADLSREEVQRCDSHASDDHQRWPRGPTASTISPRWPSASWRVRFLAEKSSGAIVRLHETIVRLRRGERGKTTWMEKPGTRPNLRKTLLLATIRTNSWSKIAEVCGSSGT
jgi:hypothetical protein